MDLVNNRLTLVTLGQSLGMNDWRHGVVSCGVIPFIFLSEGGVDKP